MIHEKIWYILDLWMKDDEIVAPLISKRLVIALFIINPTVSLIPEE